MFFGVVAGVRAIDWMCFLLSLVKVVNEVNDIYIVGIEIASRGSSKK